MEGFAKLLRAGKRALDRQARFGLQGDDLKEVQRRLDAVYRDHHGDPVDVVRAALDEAVPHVSASSRNAFANKISGGRMVHLDR